MLAGADFECREAASGVDALALLESGEKFDLLLTDMLIPIWMASPCWSEAGSSIQTCQWSSSQRYMIFRSPYSLCAMALTTTCSSRSSASNCWLQFAELSIIAASNEKTNPTSRFSRPARHKLALARGSAQQQGLPQWSRTQILFAAKSRLPLRMVEHEKEHHHGKRPNASIRLQMGGSSPSAKRGVEKNVRACS
jgi:CheY-like chemotaxis protein